MMDPRTFRRMCRARRELRSADEPSDTVREIARRAGFSVYHFIRVYRALFGETPHQARMRARLDRAKRLLAAGKASVTEACMDTGYASLGSFSSRFAERSGESPSSFRRRVGPSELERDCLSLMSDPQFPRSAGAEEVANSRPEGT